MYKSPIKNFVLSNFFSLIDYPFSNIISSFFCRLEEQIDVSEKLFDTYPILVYPCRIYDHGQHTGQLRPPRQDQMCPGTNWGMFNDLGVYGVPKKVRNKQR